jgi:heme exporter protein A
VLALRLDGVTRRYGEREALSDLTLTLQQGATLLVLGGNGAGKTTLLRLVAALLRPHAGLIEVLGRRLPSEAWMVRGNIGLLAHEPLLYKELTAEENLSFHARLHGVSRDRVNRLLAELQLSELAKEPVKTLSRGIVQRLAIARAVLHDPELLLLDEPKANLDPAASEIVEPLIGRALAGREC